MKEIIKIPSGELTLECVPLPTASFDKICRFALTFDPAERISNAMPADVLSDLTGLSIPQLRFVLYCEQRRYNHFGYPPDAETEKAMRQIPGLIREKLALKILEGKS